MAVIKFTNSKSGLKKIINYITQTEKTEARLVSGQACMPETAYDEMLVTKNMYGKNNGRQYIHIVQSFSPEESLDHNTAHAIAIKLAERFEGFQALIATHQDRDHIHSHIVLNSVNYETGLKFQQSKKELQEVKDYSDKICLSYGLSIIEKKEKQVSTNIPMEVYQAAMKGNSWKFDLINSIEDALKSAHSKANFIARMKQKGYEVQWEGSRKHITFTTPDGKKCRSNKLYDEKYTKKGLLYEIEQRAQQRIGATTECPENATGEKSIVSKHSPIYDSRAGSHKRPMGTNPHSASRTTPSGRGGNPANEASNRTKRKNKNDFER